MIQWKNKKNEWDWHEVRETVFMKEQGFQNEFDEIDEFAQHITLYLDGVLAGCIRYYMEDGVYRVGRLAVLSSFRKRGLGSMLLAHAEREIKLLGGMEAYLDAQCRVQPFSEKAGYVKCGEEHMDENVPHVLMKKAFL